MKFDRKTVLLKIWRCCLTVVIGCIALLTASCLVLQRDNGVGNNLQDTSFFESSSQNESPSDGTEKNDTSAIESTDAVTTQTEPSETEWDAPPAEEQPNGHVALDTEKYYQYSFLSNEEKVIYKRIRVAANEYQSEVNISNVNVKFENIPSIVRAFLLDNPQCFWLCGGFRYSEEMIYLNYTDGAVTDNTGYGVANHTLIDERRAQLEQAVRDILAAIPYDATEYEKELLIHDYLTKTSRYATEATTTPYINGNLVSAFNASGILVEHNGVCEGYTEAFQILCYAVGINCTPIRSDDHTWNAVQIEGEWYQVDVTWDDPVDQYGNSGNGTHDFFNLTDEEMYQTHTLTTDEQYAFMKIPQCTATQYRYRMPNREKVA